MNNNATLIPEEIIMSKIYLIRGLKVMLDMDLAFLYGVETKQLKRAVRRNIKRFPLDFMFELNVSEITKWRYQFGTSNREKMGLFITPFAFTDHDDKILLIFKYLKQLEQTKTEDQKFKERKRIGFKRIEED